MKLNPKLYRKFVRMDHRLLGFHRTRKNATIQVITKEKGYKSAAVPESAGKLFHDRWNERNGDGNPTSESQR